MSLFKRGTVWWTYVYRNGIRHQQSTGTGNRRRAEQIEAKFKEELNDEQFQIVKSDPNLTFSELAAQFIASGSVRPHHLYHLKFLLPHFADFPVLRLTKSFAEEFRRSRRRGNPKIKDATINRDLSVLRRVLYWALDEQIIPANPLARLKMARERRTRRQVLSVAEEQSLLGVAHGHLYAMTLMALDTGMRRGEITGERWEDIDFSQKVLYVTRSKTPEGESREIPLTARLREYLAGRRKGDGFVIDFRDHAVRIVKRSWKTALRNAGVRHLRFHDLRHTFNTRLMEAGVLQEVRMELMGHSPGNKVHATYTHVELPVKRDAIKTLHRWIAAQQEEIEKEKQHASTENERTESTAGEARAQTVEEKNAGGGGLRTGGQAQGRDCGDRGGSEGETETIAEVRRGQKTLRSVVEASDAASH